MAFGYILIEVYSNSSNCISTTILRRVLRVIPVEIQLGFP